MAASERSQDEREQLEAEAVTLVVRLMAGGDRQAARQAAEAWRRRGPVHDAAFQKAWRLWAGMEGLREDLVRAGLVAASDQSGERTARALSRGMKGRGWMRWGALAAAIAAVAVGVSLHTGVVARLTADYATGTGQQSSAALADGSRLQLNTQAAVSVRYSASARLVALLAGEAAFQVAKDPLRPFIVEAQGGTVRAVGTEFLVHAEEEGALVTVVEGVVEVRTEAEGRTGGVPVLVEAGQRVRYSRTAGVGPVEPADLQLATAWRRGKLMFDAAPLAAVIEELNRYRPGYILLLNNTLAAHPVSGVFDVNRLDSAVATIEETLAVTTVRLTDRFVLLR